MLHLAPFGLTSLNILTIHLIVIPLYIAFTILIGFSNEQLVLPYFLIARSVNIYRAHHTLRASKRQKMSRKKGKKD